MIVVLVFVRLGLSVLVRTDKYLIWFALCLSMPFKPGKPMATVEPVKRYYQNAQKIVKKG